MPVSQYRVYNSNDTGAPQITHAAGSLLAVLNACLVDGLPGKAAAGWTKPLVDASNCGCFKQGAGAQLVLYVNDDGPDPTALYKHAWVTGWESITSVTGPVGTGSGQFPTPSQLLTTGHAVSWKTFTADATERPWICFADASTFYLFIAIGDGTGVYNGLWFGDIFSFRTTPDPWRCFLFANNNLTSSTSGNTVHWAGHAATPTTSQPGRYMARTFGGGQGSIAVGFQGDLAHSVSASYLGGLISGPNGPDNSFYVAPVTVFETSTGVIRGRLRGVWHVLHTAATFGDGQQINGAGDYANRVFQIVKSDTNGGFLAFEVSNSVETN